MYKYVHKCLVTSMIIVYDEYKMCKTITTRHHSFTTIESFFTPEIMIFLKLEP